MCVCVLCGPRQRWNAECRRPLEALLSFSCVVYVCVCVLPPFCPIPGRLPVFPTSSTEKSSFFFLSFFSFLLYHLDSPALGVIAAHVDIKLCFFYLSLFSFFKEYYFQVSTTDGPDQSRKKKKKKNLLIPSGRDAEARRAGHTPPHINAKSEAPFRFDSYGRLHPLREQHCRGYKSKGERGGGSIHIIPHRAAFYQPRSRYENNPKFLLLLLLPPAGLLISAERTDFSWYFFICDASKGKLFLFLLPHSTASRNPSSFTDMLPRNKNCARSIFGRNESLGIGEGPLSFVLLRGCMFTSFFPFPIRYCRRRRRITSGLKEMSFPVILKGGKNCPKKTRHFFYYMRYISFYDDCVCLSRLPNEFSGFIIAWTAAANVRRLSNRSTVHSLFGS